MQARTKYAIALIALTLVILAVRLLISFEVEHPSYASHFTLRQTEEIIETGRPLYEDPLSYQGRRHAFNPLFYYVMAAFALFLPATFVLKLLPNLFMVSLIPLAYLIGHHLTRHRAASLVAAFFAATTPILFTSFLNEATPLSLALPVSAALLLALLDIEQHPRRALLLIVLLTLLSPVIWLFLLSFLIYLLILAAERLTIRPAYMEAALFTFLFAAWYTLITYKAPLFREGVAILWASLPATVRAAMFTDFTLLAMIYAVGVIPLALGSYALYHNAFEVRVRKLFLLGAFALSALLLAILRAIPLRLALLFLSLSFILLSAPALHTLLTYFRRTRFPMAGPLILGALLCFFVLTSLLPAVATGIYPQSSPTENEVAAMEWLQEETPEESVVMAAPKSGFLINARANRAAVADEDYLLVRNVDGILADLDQAYTTPFTVAATEIITRYGVTHILLGPAENTRYGEVGAVAQDRDCFPVAYRNPQVLIFSVNCTLARGGR